MLPRPLKLPKAFHKQKDHEGRMEEYESSSEGCPAGCGGGGSDILLAERDLAEAVSGRSIVTRNRPVRRCRA